MTESQQAPEKPLSVGEQLVTTGVSAALALLCGYGADRTHGFWQVVTGGAALVFIFAGGASFFELLKALGRKASGRRSS